ncbi:conjugal transfer protein [Lampropedia puyangensis]|uniref:Conjugal transfer protein n=1 Tax=Lampropedia puyangensis TaxID=1330072 RepID=A0A4S8EZX8_9BURK|nr:RAQPRD family integrative conjugative element protein [Lampropedia puyangensis]THT98401.1 conjugal transfer protein [Lampropedia puyangensis]
MHPLPLFVRVPTRSMLSAIALGCALATSPSAWATGSDIERERLAVIENELVRLKSLVAQAHASAPTGQRVRFHYDWLLADLELIQKGINDHMDAPRQPRPVPALRGDYRQ